MPAKLFETAAEIVQQLMIRRVHNYIDLGGGKFEHLLRIVS